MCFVSVFDSKILQKKDWEDEVLSLEKPIEEKDLELLLPKIKEEFYSGGRKLEKEFD